MAVVSQQLLQMGPPQAVHIRAMQWRPAQFRDPAVTYHYRARIEPSPTSGSVFPPRILRRDYPPAHASSGVKSSGSASSLTSSLSSSGFTRFRVHPAPPPLWRTTEATTQKDVRGPRFTVTAQAVVMQPRPPQRSRLATGSSKFLGAQPFSYPDPTRMRGDVAFDIRLAELARLESDTIKYEEWKSRSKITSCQMDPPSRPYSSYGRSSRPATPKAASLPAHRVSIATAVPQERSIPLLNRKTSLPATLHSKSLYMYSDRNFARSASHSDETRGSGGSLGVVPDQPHSSLAVHCTGKPDSVSARVQEDSSQCSPKTGDVSIGTSASSKNSTIAIESKDSAIHTASEIELASAIQSLEIEKPTEQPHSLVDSNSSPKFTTGTLRASSPESDWQIVATVTESNASESPCKEDDLQVTSITDLSSNCKDSTNGDTKPEPKAVRRVARRKGGAKASRSKGAKKTSSKLRSHSTPRLDCGNADVDIPVQTPSLCSLKVTGSKKKHGNSKSRKYSTCSSKRSK